MGSLSIDIDITAVLRKYGPEATKRATGDTLAGTLEYAAGLVRERMPVETGFMRNNTTFKLASTKEGKIYAQGVFYMKFVEEGTGIHGKYRTPIRPRNAARLAWHGTTATGKPTGEFIVRRTVKGQQAVRMFQRTATEDRKQIARHFETTFKRELRI